MSVTPNRRAAFEALSLDRDDDDPRRAGDARARELFVMSSEGRGS
jgi:hypothetical protein